MRETMVANHFGLSPAELKSIRDAHCVEDEHWRKKGREIIWLEDGLARVEGVLAALQQKKGQDEAQGGGDEEFASVADGGVLAGALAGLMAPTLKRMRVQAIPRNPKLVLAVPADEKNGGPEHVVRVRVRSNQNFLPGMELNARMESEEQGVLEGRCPRYRGRY
jgi:hypothetical protein